MTNREVPAQELIAGDRKEAPRLLCHVKYYCDVPIGWLMNMETHTRRTFIGIDQAIMGLNELKGKSQSIQMQFCLEVDVAEVAENWTGKISAEFTTEEEFIKLIEREREQDGHYPQ